MHRAFAALVAIALGSAACSAPASERPREARATAATPATAPASPTPPPSPSLTPPAPPSPAPSPAARPTAASPAIPVRSARGFPLGDLRITSGASVVLSLRVEIADTTEALATGLMHVERLGDDEGMAFLLPGPTRRAFWMKNTLIPLDIAFWDAGGRIVDILHMEPCRVADCPLYEPAATYVGAVEVNLGLLERSGVKAGDVVALERR